MTIHDTLLTILCAGACILPLGALAIVMILIKEKENKATNATIIAIVTILVFFCSSLYIFSSYVTGAPFPIFKPSDSDIVGIYYLSGNSVRYLQEKGYPSISADSFIEFGSDQRFRTEKMPDLISMNFENDANLEFVSGEGTWEIKSDSTNSEWYLFLIFTKLNDKPSEQATYLYLNGIRPPFVLYSIVGDPDSYEWLMYKKK